MTNLRRADMAGKIVTVVLDDNDYRSKSPTSKDPEPEYALFRDMVRENIEFVCPGAIVCVKSWSDFVLDLPEMKSDRLVILSPRNLGETMGEFRSGLERFRSRNPLTPIVMSSLHRPETEEGKFLKGLLSQNLLHYVEDLTFPWEMAGKEIVGDRPASINEKVDAA